MMQDGDKFVKEIERMAIENKVQNFSDDDGREYFSKKLHPVIPNAPEPLQLSTLDGLVDMIAAEDLDCSIYVSGPRKVVLRGALDPLWRQREIYAASTIQDNGFPFEREMSIEDFIINLQCNFDETPEKKKVIDLVSSITASAVTTAEDDGLAQEVQTKQAIGHKKSLIQLDPIVELKPFRTFREIEQPSDKFLLRMHPRNDQLPLVSLRSAGGDMWKNEAINSIYEYLKAKVPETTAAVIR